MNVVKTCRVRPPSTRWHRAVAPSFCAVDWSPGDVRAHSMSTRVLEKRAEFFFREQ